MNGLVLFVWWDNGVEPINADSYPKWKNTIRLRVPVAMDAQAKGSQGGTFQALNVALLFFFQMMAIPQSKQRETKKRGKERESTDQTVHKASGEEREAKIAKGR